MAKPRFRFTKVRDVKAPTRNNQGDAGLDFYVPVDLTLSDLLTANKSAEDVEYSGKYACEGGYSVSLSEGKVVKIFIGPKTRVLIPSGIRGLLEPQASMLQANNKSGKSTKQGLIFTAEVVDSPYVGEYHLGVYNTSNMVQAIEAGSALVQFVHIPVYLSTPEEISNEDYEKESANWGTRGTNGFGSSDKQEEK